MRLADPRLLLPKKVFRQEKIRSDRRSKGEGKLPARLAKSPSAWLDLLVDNGYEADALFFGCELSEYLLRLLKHSAVHEGSLLRLSLIDLSERPRLMAGPEEKRLWLCRPRRSSSGLRETFHALESLYWAPIAGRPWERLV